MKRKWDNTLKSNNIFTRVKWVENNLHEGKARFYFVDPIPFKMSYNWKTKSLESTFQTQFFFFPVKKNIL